MPELHQWLKLYRSPNPAVQVRAAEALLGRSSQVPLTVLLDILDRLHDQGLGAATERALLERQDPGLTAEMIHRLDSEKPYLQETACTVLGKSGDRTATPYLIGMLRSPHLRVRRAAAFALAFLKDPASIPVLIQVYCESRDDNINVRMGLEAALESLGVSYTRHSW